MNKYNKFNNVMSNTRNRSENPIPGVLGPMSDSKFKHGSAAVFLKQNASLQNVFPDSYRHTRLANVWANLHQVAPSLLEVEWALLVGLLIYGVDADFGDVLTFAQDIRNETLHRFFKNHYDLVVLERFMLEEFQVKPGEEYHAEADVDASVNIGEQNSTLEFKEHQQETVTFMDNQELLVLDMSQAPEETRMNEDHELSSSLSNFLSRPRNIGSFTWQLAEFDNIDNYVEIFPWEQYVQGPIIKKTDNFRMLRATGLHIQFRVNGSPFHYGRLYACYMPGKHYPFPFAGQRNPFNTVVPPTNMGSFNAGNFPLLTQYSQMPGVFIDPTTNVVAEMTLPFFWPQNYISLLNADDLQNMGRLYIIALNPLRHSNGGTDPVTLTVTAWLEDPILAMPTETLTYNGEGYFAEAGAGTQKSPPARTRRRGKQTNSNVGTGNKTSSKSDEYGKGVISRPATALANFAGTLSAVPVIGSYARATQIGANAVSSIAGLFGFSKPVNLTPDCLMNYTSYGPMAVTEHTDSSKKLTLDPKQEITIDPVTVGLQSIDEMSVAHIAKRESLLVQIPWSTTNLRTTNLVHIAVSPFNHPMHLSGNRVDFHTALSWVTNPFRLWRGSIKYRFQVVASQLHRGRLAFVYHPNGKVSTTLPELPSTYQQFMDLTETRDITITIRYAHPNPWLRTQTPATVYINSGGTTFTTEMKNMSNGALSVYVLNELAAPINTSVITLNVYISAGDDFMLANPANITFPTTTPYTHFMREQYTAEADPFFAEAGEQADYTAVGESSSVYIARNIVLNGDENDTPDVDNVHSVFIGEQFVSLRNIIKRYSQYAIRPISRAANVNGTEMLLYHGMMPVARGVAGQNGNLSMGTSDAVGSFNYVNTTWLSYFLEGFVAYRGSVRWKYMWYYVQSQNLAPIIHMQSMGNMKVERDPEPRPSIQRYALNFTINNAVAVADSYSEQLQTFSTLRSDTSHTGTELSYVPLKNGIEFEHPFYSSQRFLWRAQGAVLNGGFSVDAEFFQHDDLNHDAHLVRAYLPTFSGGASALDTYVAAGEDFSLHYFLCAPVLGPGSFTIIP